MKFIFHPEAEDEFFDAIEYYEAVDVGLGYDFSMEVLATVRNITEYPLAWPILIENVRRCLTNRFPFGVIYSIEGDHIHVLAVMHLRRKPGYWEDRR